MEQGKVTVYVAGSCGPCKQVKRLIGKGKINRPVDIIDVETEQGFPLIEKMGLSKVPAAYLGETQCNLSFSKDGQALVVECPEDK